MCSISSSSMTPLRGSSRDSPDGGTRRRSWINMTCAKRNSPPMSCGWWSARSSCITLDTLWKDHLLSMDHLKEGIGLRGYGQKNPLREYQKEGFDMFVATLSRMRELSSGEAVQNPDPARGRRGKDIYKASASSGCSSDAARLRRKPAPSRGREKGRQERSVPLRLG